MPAKASSLPTPAESPDYSNLIDLLAVYSDATDRLAELQSRLNDDQRSLVDDARDEYVELQTKLGEAEAAVEVICRRHPEWFKKAKTLKTLYGAAGFRETTRVIVPDERAAITLITAAGRDADFVRTVRELDLEALEKLGDDELAKFGLIRKTDNAFSLKPAKLDLGKAVQEQQPEAREAKAA